jgi:hypothetical protein
VSVYLAADAAGDVPSLSAGAVLGVGDAVRPPWVDTVAFGAEWPWRSRIALADDAALLVVRAARRRAEFLPDRVPGFAGELGGAFPLPPSK